MTDFRSRFTQIFYDFLLFENAMISEDIIAASVNHPQRSGGPQGSLKKLYKFLFFEVTVASEKITTWQPL